MNHNNNLQKRTILFLFGCIFIRSLFVGIAKSVHVKHLKYLGYLALLPALGFMYIYLTGSRKTGLETFGEKIWWNNLRPVHSILYIAFAYNAIIGNKHAWVFLAADVFIGFFGFVLHHLCGF